MSHWCSEHPRYTAKREPAGLCNRCWALWFLRNPEGKAALVREYVEGMKLEDEWSENR